jgi:hypothetical protein
MSRENRGTRPEARVETAAGNVRARANLRSPRLLGARGDINKIASSGHWLRAESGGALHIEINSAGNRAARPSIPIAGARRRKTPIKTRIAADDTKNNRANAHTWRAIHDKYLKWPRAMEQSLIGTDQVYFRFEMCKFFHSLLSVQLKSFPLIQFIWI